METTVNTSPLINIDTVILEVSYSVVLNCRGVELKGGGGVAEISNFHKMRGSI